MNVWPEGLAAVVALGWFGYRLWRFNVRPRLVAAPDGLHIRQGRKPITVAWTDIVDAIPGHGGIEIICRDGSRHRSRVGEKSNLARWRKWRRPADDIADEILARAEQARGPRV